MLVWSVITGIFWAIVIAVVLWVLCAFAGRIVNPNYRMPPLLHLICFAVAIPTVVLLAVVFSCNKINRKLSEVDTGIAKILMTDGKFISQLQKEINRAATTKDADELTDYIAENFSEKISSEYSGVGKYVDVNQILKKTDFDKEISKLTQVELTAGKAQEIIQDAAGEFTKGVRTKVKSVRRKSLIALIIFQALPFGINFYKASNYRSPVSRPKYSYSSNDGV